MRKAQRHAGPERLHFLRRLEPLPASADSVATFLAAQAAAGAKASTLGRRAAAIRYAPRLAGHEPPTGAQAVMRPFDRAVLVCHTAIVARRCHAVMRTQRLA